MTTKITGLSKSNVAAIRETGIPAVLTATTATFPGSPLKALHAVQDVIASLPGRAHPKASLHAVARKLRAQALNGRQDVPSEPQAPAKPAVELCRNSGVTHPRRLYSECVDCGKQGKVTGAGILRAHKPQEITLQNLLSF